MNQDTPALLLHAGGNDGRQWRPVARGLAARGIATVCPDLIAPRDGGVADLEAQVDAMAAAARAIGRPFHLVGHSYGGFVALRLAARADLAIRGVVLFEPTVAAILGRCPDGERLLDEWRDLIAAVEAAAPLAGAERFVRYWAGDAVWALLDDRGRDRVAGSIGPLAREWTMTFAEPCEPAAMAARVPPARWLVVDGGRSPTPSRAICDRLAVELPGARRHTIAGAGHFAPLLNVGPTVALLAREILG